MKTVIFMTLIVVVTALIFSAEAKKKSSGFGKKPGSHGGGGTKTFYSWTRTVNATNISEKGLALTNDGGDAVMVSSYGRGLRDEGLSRAATLYDFRDASTVVVTKAGRNCYVIPTPAGLNFTLASAEIAERNGTTVTDPLTEVQLNATGQRMSRADRRALITSNPGVARFCGRSFIFSPAAADAASFPSPGGEAEREVVTSVVTLDSKVSILSMRPKRKPGKPGKPRG